MKTLRLPFSLAVGALFALAIGGGQKTEAQGTYPQTLPVPVTFYDFHSDRTNPEFEQPHGKGTTSGLRKGMVAPTLDADGKPQMGSDPYLNHGIRFWFRDSKNLGSYKMASENDPVYPSHKYLEKFRPVYMYSNNRYPPYRRQTTSSWGGQGGEWDATPTTGRTEVPYAYANSTFSTSYNGGSQITAGATGFQMNDQYYTIDTAFKNVVINDIDLIFNHVGNGTYQFVRDKGASQQFFPLNGRGFQENRVTSNNWICNGSNGSDRNYSYTMELVWGFNYRKGTNQDFSFYGDDDVWVFVNNRLVLDLGGIHEQTAGTFNLDNLAGSIGLNDGDSTQMRLFYVERHSDDANIKITTNIISVPPGEVDLRVNGGDLVAGVPKVADAIVWGSDGKRITNFSNGTFTWSARETRPGNGSANNPTTARVGTGNTDPGNGDIRIWSKRSGTATNKSDSIYIVANKAYTDITLSVTYTEGGVTVTRDIPLTVKPGPAKAVWIEGSEGSTTVNQWAARPLTEITIERTAQSTESFWAVLRDSLGNWVGPAAHGGGSSNAWATARGDVATATNGTAPLRGQGRAVRMKTIGDTTRLTLTHTTSAGTRFTANSIIRLLDVEYIGIRVGVKVGGTFYQIPGDSILISLPGDTTVYVQLQRGDNYTWVESPANWKAVATGGGTAPVNIPAGVSYTYSPDVPGYILLIATTISGSASDTMRIRSDYRTPASLRFFNTNAAPTSFSDTLTKYPAKDSKQYLYPVPTAPVNIVQVAAGDTMKIFTAAFSSNPPAINAYIPPSSLTGKFVWSIVNNTDANATKITPQSLDYAAHFRSTLAHQTHVVRVAYVVGTDTIVRQELWVQVIPGAIAAVYIEPESQDLTRSSMNKPLTFNGRAPVLGDDGVILRVEDTLYMTNLETSRQAYALLRDKWGNYVAPSGGYYPYWDTYYSAIPTIADPPTVWSSNGVVAAGPGGNPSMGQGLITRDPESQGLSDVVTAEDKTYKFPANGNPGRLPVTIRDYSYTELKIVEKDGKHIDEGGTLRITTNDEPTLVVIGKKSNCDNAEIDPTYGLEGKGCWEEVPATWGPDEGLSTSLTPPPPGSTWKLDPRRRGDGKIMVSRPGVDEQGHPITITAELPVEIKLGPPLRAELVIITPPEQVKAGEDITAEVRYYNRTGLMDEWDPSWNSANDRASFNDNQTTPPDWIPSVTSESGKNTLGYRNNQKTANARLAPDPKTGRATVIFVLYNATDNPHTLSYAEEIAGVKLTATAELTLRPGDPDKIVITSEGGDRDGGKLDIDHEDVVILVAEGEDKYGNKTGEESSKWCIPKDAAIPQSNANCDGSSPTIVYDTKEAEKDGCGKLTVTPTNPDVKGDTLQICIKNVSLKPLFAITRDDGDGYLDAVDVVFATKFQSTTLAGKFDASKINLRYNGSKLPVKGVTIKDSIVTLELDEAKSGALQTGWEPTLDIESGLIENVRFSNKEVRDGAAPVIYTAKLYFDQSGEKTRDYIEVKFSEKIRATEREFNATSASLYPPNTLFYIWKLKDNGMSKVRNKKLSKTSAADTRSFDLVRDALDGIAGVSYIDDMTLRFALENGRELKPPSDYINILADNKKDPNVRSEIRDKLTPPNVPDESNRKVPITYANEPSEKMIPVPNPASPDKTPVGNSVEAKNPNTGKPVSKDDSHKYIGAFHNPDAVPHIRAGGGGAVFQVPLYIPKDIAGGSNGGGAKIKCQTKVYDLAGNLVSSGEEDDMARVRNQKMEYESETYTQIHLFWSGFNSKGMKAAPGTYRIIVQISYPGSKDPQAKAKKYQGTVGIAK